MKKRIVITGGLGYIGSELLKVYSGVSWHHDICVIDNRFISERVSQLRSWNIDFKLIDILDKKSLKPIIENADIIHHLAGITDVAYVKTQANSELDKKIEDIAIQGTKNILSLMKDTAKIIFPSTHVVFEGYAKTITNIKEDQPKKPVLMYSSCKAVNEEDIVSSGKKYVILRLGSVYGFSTDTMRVGIMPNLFSRIASQDGTISLFSGGKQLKSIVPLLDVARCFRYMEDNDSISNQTFNVSLDEITVREVGEACKKINPKLKLIKTDDEIPNLGYTISNKKLLLSGFEFLHSLENSLKEMIDKWSKRKLDPRSEYKQEGINPFIDERGKIINYELTEPINLVGYIDSKKGSMRANHYHPIQEQKALLISGQYISVSKDLLKKDSPIISQIVNPGDLIVTKPNVAHTMVFTKDSVFLNLVRGEREHKNYGVTHTIPYELVNNDLRDSLIKGYKSICRTTGSKNLIRVVSLGNHFLANNLLDKKNQESQAYPLELNFCPESQNCQLSFSVDKKLVFSEYLYMSSTSNSFQKHFNDAAKKYIKLFKLKKGSSSIIDIGSNDGIGLRHYKDQGFKRILGIEPAKNLSKVAIANGIPTQNSFFNKATALKLKEKADLITASNVFAHVDDIKSMTEGIMLSLKEKGVFIIEVQYMMKMIQDLTFDNIYHEHVNYWSLTSLKIFFDKQEAKIFNVEEIDTHGGSLRVYISKNNKVRVDSSVKKLLKKELDFGMDNPRTYQKFAKKITDSRERINKKIDKLKKQYPVIAGYGSPAKATTLINYYGIGHNIDYIIEDNPLKNGKFLPGAKIPIISKEKIQKKPDLIIVLAWNFFDEIRKNNKGLCKKFISVKDL